jgi:Uncharacterized protein conserved in bacteria
MDKSDKHIIAERNIGLDYFKIFLSLLVVTIHLPPLFDSAILHSFISNGIARIAVPSFFIISGYYFYPKIGDTKACRKYILRLLILSIVWIIIYFPLFFYPMDSFSIRGFLLVSIFGYGHLWYITASIISISLIFVSKKIIKNDFIIFFIALAFFLIALYLMYGNGVNVNEFNIYRFRNGLCFGFVFTSIGCLINSKQWVKKIKEKHLLFMIFLFSILFLAESLLRHEFLSTPFHDLYLTSILLAPILLIYIFKHPIKKAGANFIGVLSVGIYFIHYYVIEFVPILFDGYIRFIIVVLISVGLSYILYLINKRINIFF